MSASEVFKNAICGHLVVAKLDLIEIDSSCTAAEAVDLMKNHHIQSIPVYDKTRHGYIGTVSMFDALMYATKNASGDSIDTQAQTILQSATVRNLIGLYKEAKTGKKAGGLLGVQAATPLAAVLKPLSEGIPRILVALGFVKTDPSKPLFRLLSSTDVISYINGRIEQLPDIASKPVSACMTSDILVKDLTSNTREALLSIFDEGGDAIAVTNRDGALVATLSVSDCRDLAALSGMTLSIEDFLKTVNYGVVREPVSVKPSDELTVAMRKAISAHIHRVWVVDDDQKPVGVVRLQDMIRMFVS